MSNAFIIWLKAQQAGMLAMASRDQFTAQQAAYFTRLESTIALFRQFEQDELVAVFDEQSVKPRQSRPSVKGTVNFDELVKKEQS